VRITAVSARDIRFPASCDLSGSDAMHEAPDCSAAHVVLRTVAGEASKPTA
jgi:L-fuconate dehydratase